MNDHEYNVIREQCQKLGELMDKIHKPDQFLFQCEGYDQLLKASQELDKLMNKMLEDTELAE